MEDGVFGEMDGRIRGAETNRMLREVDDLVKVYTEGSSASEHARKEHFFDYMPTISKEAFLREFKPVDVKTLPVLLKGCHHYEFRNLDVKRRKRLPRQRWLHRHWHRMPRSPFAWLQSRCSQTRPDH